MDNNKVAALRKEYALRSLEEKDILTNPFLQFKNWFEETMNAEIEEPNGMTLSTIDEQGWPSSRIVLLKGFDENGFVFFTNYESQKGKALLSNPRASIVFWWKELHRQVRIKGDVEKVAPSASLEYFVSRPKGSQIGAWASPQSSVIPDRSFLEKRFQEVADQYKDESSLPLPPHWGGYVVKPIEFEFWQGRQNRLHDRFRFTRNAEKDWNIERLAS